MPEKDLRRTVDEYMNWLSDLPEEEIRRRFRGMRIPCNVDFVWEIGGTEYTVVSHFKRNHADDFVKIIEWLLEGDISG